MTHKTDWIDFNREAQCPADPAYPDGIDLDLTIGGPEGGLKPGRKCKVVIPYPALGCGVWDITCDKCNVRIAVTAAGRVDDPRSATILCGWPT